MLNTQWKHPLNKTYLDILKQRIRINVVLDFNTFVQFLKKKYDKMISIYRW